MENLNTNCMMVLVSIVDRDNNLGLTKGRGTNKEKILKKSKLSLSTVNRSLKLLMKEELIDEALKQVNKKAYYVTEKGKDKLKEIKGKKK